MRYNIEVKSRRQRVSEEELADNPARGRVRVRLTVRVSIEETTGEGERVGERVRDRKRGKTRKTPKTKHVKQAG